MEYIEYDPDQSLPFEQIAEQQVAYDNYINQLNDRHKMKSAIMTVIIALLIFVCCSFGKAVRMLKYDKCNGTDTLQVFCKDGSGLPDYDPNWFEKR